MLRIKFTSGDRNILIQWWHDFDMIKYIFSMFVFLFRNIWIWSTRDTKFESPTPSGTSVSENVSKTTCSQSWYFLTSEATWADQSKCILFDFGFHSKSEFDSRWNWWDMSFWWHWIHGRKEWWHVGTEWWHLKMWNEALFLQTNTIPQLRMRWVDNLLPSFLFPLLLCTFWRAEFQSTNLHFVFQMFGRILKCGFEIFREAVETSSRAPASKGLLQCSSCVSILIPEICQIAEKL